MLALADSCLARFFCGSHLPIIAVYLLSGADGCDGPLVLPGQLLNLVSHFNMCMATAPDPLMALYHAVHRFCVHMQMDILNQQSKQASQV